MPVKLANTYNPRTEFGKGLANIANAMFGTVPTDEELQNAEVKRNYQRALEGEAALRTEKTAMEIAQMDRAQEAREGIAGAFGQVQQLAAQTAGMGVEDPGLATAVTGLPTAVAKYGVGGGLDPQEMGRYAYMAGAPYATEEQMRRLIPSFGGIPTATTAITPGQVERVQQAQTGRALAQQTMAGQQAMARQQAKPIAVQGPDGMPQYVTQERAIAEAMQPVPKTAQRAPKVFGLDQYDDVLALLDERMGVVRDDEGNPTTAGQAPLSADLEREVVLDAGERYGQTGNLPMALEEALRAKLGADPEAALETHGRTSGWFARERAGERRLRAPAATTARTVAGAMTPQAQAEQQGKAPQAYTQTPGMPQRGQVYDGYRYLGGDPNDPNSWELADA